jgi:threonine/homoserine/homoserine lactone efflux protein
MPIEMIAQLVVLGVGVAISPVAVIAAILLLVSPGGRAKASLFVAGWVLALAVISGVVVAAEGALGAGEDAGPTRVVAAITLVLGIVLLAFGMLRWRGRPAPGDDEPTPAWMTAVDAATPLRALGLGALLAVAKPKNLVLTLAAATAIAEPAASAAGSAVALAAYVVVASASVATPLVVAVALGDRAGPVLERWKVALLAHNKAIMAVVFIAFGLLLAWKGVVGLV